MNTMYPAKINSPSTVLAEPITTTGQTSIEVADAGVLPEAPNLAVLGAGEDAETIRYTAKDGNILTVERGFQGSAQEWEAGTPVSRLFTAYDHDTFRGNLDTLDGDLGDHEAVQSTDTILGHVTVDDDTIEATDGEISVKKDYAEIDGTYDDLRAKATTKDDVGLGNVVDERQTVAKEGGQNIWVQSAEPTAEETGDLWIETE